MFIIISEYRAEQLRVHKILIGNICKFKSGIIMLIIITKGAMVNVIYYFIYKQLIYKLIIPPSYHNFLMK